MSTVLDVERKGYWTEQRPNEFGKVLPGFYADLILVDCNPLQDITILQDITRVTAVTKNSEFHREPAEHTRQPWKRGCHFISSN